ncbi:uncharacterized protein involved in outer membrane biogenesis [Constrictibacter sp. MBR-5]|jgi:AsmA protein|uniref:AsmA family protein n=1 Tax=Constrictibacter sp. MBR-5 TaxID=3156467 RepID=UPI0033946B84
MKKVAIGIGALIVVIVVALFAVPALIDWNGYKPQIAAAVKDATGRELVIEGDLAISVLPSVRFSAAGVKFANATGMEPAYMASVQRIEGEVALLPLLGRTIVVKRLLVEQPEADLRVDAAGNPNWVFSGSPADAQDRPEPQGEEAGFGGEVRIENARIVGGRIGFADARTGQRIDAVDVGVDLSVPGLSDVATFDARMTLNGDPVTARFSLDTPRRVIDGEKAQAVVALESPKARAGYTGGVQNQPVPGLDGTFDLDIPSVGSLVGWLGRPLPAGQPDPGPVKAHAVFAADGPRMALTEAVLQGRDLDAKASGSVDLSGPAPKVALTVESGVINVDRYLPPPPKETLKAPPSKAGPRDGPIASLPDEALDLETLRQGEADIRVRIAGIRVMGFTVGQTDFTATLKDGKLAADLDQLQIYGGTVQARTTLDASGPALALAASGKVDKVDVGALARAASPKEQPPVAGVVSATLEADGHGESVRKLAESLKGRLTADLGGMNVANAAAGALSGLTLDLTLPGLDREPTLAATFVYNREKVSVQAQTSPLPQIVSGDRFDLDASVKSAVVTAGYDGAVIKAPVAGLDGTFTFYAPSAARMAAWLGRPIEGQDPGPIKARAVFAGDGAKIVLREATIASAGLDATAKGSWEQKGAVTQLALDVKGGVLDVDRYVGPAAPAASPAGTGPAGNPFATLPNEPVDLSALRNLDADVKVDLAGVKAAGQRLGRVALTARVDRGIATMKVDELALYGGRVGGTVKADASGKVLALDADLKASGVRVDELLQASGGPPVLGGTAALDLTAQSRGASARALADALSGRLTTRLAGGGQGQIPLSDLDLSLDLPGMAKQASLQVAATYNGEKVTATATVKDPRAALGGNRFPASLSLSAAPVTAGFDGTVQQAPLPGLDGKVDLDVASVARLAAWLGQPLDQPDPGPLKVTATLAADGPRIALKQATIDGKALKATAEGSIDTTSMPRRFDAKVVVREADLDAYLPPSVTAAPQKPTPGQPTATTGWNEEPIDLAALRENTGKVDVTLNAVRYRGLVVETGRMTATLAGGTLTTALSDVRTAGGSIAGKASLADTGRGVKLDYDASASGLAARPLLTAFAGTDRLAGTASFAAQGTGTGRSQKDLMSSLDGAGSFKFLDGAVYGINIAAALRKVGAAGLDQAAGAEQKTDFAELSGTYVIRDGIVENKDLKMLAPLLRLGGGGTVDLPRQTVDYTVDATLVASLKGQGGNEDLAGIPVPIRITGPWSAPRYDVQWDRMLQNLAKDPEKLKNLPGSLKDLAAGSGVKLPIPGLGTGDGTGSGAGGIGGLLQGLTGQRAAPSAPDGAPTGGTSAPAAPTPPKSPTAPQAPTTQSAPSSTPQAGQPKPRQESEPEKLLRGLFNR